VDKILVDILKDTFLVCGAVVVFTLIAFYMVLGFTSPQPIYRDTLIIFFFAVFGATLGLRYYLAVEKENWIEMMSQNYGLSRQECNLILSCPEHFIKCLLSITAERYYDALLLSEVTPTPTIPKPTPTAVSTRVEKTMGKKSKREKKVRGKEVKVELEEVIIGGI